MKKIISLILGILIFATVLTSCGGDSDSIPETTAPAVTDAINDGQYESLKRQLAGDWSMYLAHKESLCLDMYWMLDYLDAFYQNPSWETLSRARCALGVIEAKFEATEFPEYSVTVEQHNELIVAGYNINGLWAEMNRLESIKAEFLTNCRNLTMQFYYNNFFAPLFDCSVEYAAIIRESVDIELEYAACHTDNLMFELRSEKIKNDFMAFLKENEFQIVKYMPEYSVDSAAITQKNTEIMDKLDANVNKLNINVGKTEVAFNSISEILKNNDTAALNAAKQVIAGDAHLFPLSAYYDESKASFYYMYSADDASFTHYFAGDEIKNIPNAGRITYSDATETQYKEYFLALSNLGINPDIVNDTDKEYSSTYIFGDSSVSISYKDGAANVTILGDDIFLVPLQYIK